MDESLEDQDPSDPREKRPIGEKKKKKKKGVSVGTLSTKSNTVIPIALNNEEEEFQLREILERSMVEKRAINVPYLEGVEPIGLKL